MSRDIFGNTRAFGMFEEPVEVHAAKKDSDETLRAGTVAATVIVGSGQNSGAGGAGHPETGDRVSVIVRRGEWGSAFDFEPRFGMRFVVEDLGEVVVKSVQAARGEYVCRCSQNMRARER
jgi:hypothetical protein